MGKEYENQKTNTEENPALNFSKNIGQVKTMSFKAFIPQNQSLVNTLIPSLGIGMFTAMMFLVFSCGKVFADSPSNPRPLVKNSEKVRGEGVSVYLEDSEFGISAPQFSYEPKMHRIAIEEKKPDERNAFSSKVPGKIQTAQFYIGPVKNESDWRKPRYSVLKSQNSPKPLGGQRSTPVQGLDSPVPQSDAPGFSFDTINEIRLFDSPGFNRRSLTEPVFRGSSLEHRYKTRRSESESPIRQVAFFQLVNEPPLSDIIDAENFICEEKGTTPFFSISKETGIVPSANDPQIVLSRSREPQIFRREPDFKVRDLTGAAKLEQPSVALVGHSSRTEKPTTLRKESTPITPPDPPSFSRIVSQRRNEIHTPESSSVSGMFSQNTTLSDEYHETSLTQKYRNSGESLEESNPQSYDSAQFPSYPSPGSMLDFPKIPVVEEKLPPIKNDLLGSWKKGGFTITPYGYLNISAAWESQRTVSGDYCVYARSPELNPSSDRSGFSVDPRSTRLGMEIQGPGIPQWSGSKTRGVVEIDFQGSFETRNRSSLLFRKAFVEIGDERTKFLIGQDWEIVAPLYPEIFNYPAGSGVGNIGYRRAMLKWDHTIPRDCDSSLRLQFGICDNTIRDYTSSSAENPKITSSGWPILQGRVAYSFGECFFQHRTPITFGVSGQIGEQREDFGNEILGRSQRTWVVCFDFDVPLTSKMRLQGEIYNGENVSNLEGGIVQGIDRVRHDTIRCRGGWAMLQYRWTEKLRTNVGFSFEDPYNRDLLGTASLGGDRFSSRTYNHSIIGNIIYNWTPSLLNGLELSFWKTDWRMYDASTNTISRVESGEPVRIEFVTRYTF